MRLLFLTLDEHFHFTLLGTNDHGLLANPSPCHQPAMEWTAKAAVSWETPTKTEPRLARGS
jgi:hypothetical protein